MSNRSYLERWKSISSRLNFVEHELGSEFASEEAAQAYEAVQELFRKCRELYGAKIAREIECKVGKK